MMFDEKARKKYSSGSLLKKKSCGGRTIRIESLDEATKDRVNGRVANASKQYVVESHNGLQSDDIIFSESVKTLKLKIK